MLIRISAAAVQGIDAIPITIETVVDRGIGFTIVGLPDTAVKESAERVRTALSQTGEEWPRRHLVVNLSPGDVRKEGAAYDLPMAVAILAANEKLPCDNLSNYMIMGELSLDGSVLPIKGALPIAILARKMGFKGLIVPADNVTEAAVVNNLDVYGVKTLSEVINFFRNQAPLEPTVINTREEFANAVDVYSCDFSEVKGQERVKRALEVACAGGHNVLMVGPPGSGKSMMAKRMPTIMPPLTLGEALETTKIHSVAGKLRSGTTLMTTRPFRSPHHTISPVALVGGGVNPMPGEISLAHNGLLFMDEFPEFPRTVLEVLRQPLEDRYISISRAKYAVDYPAGFMLVASMNPCPCGYYNHPSKECTCSPVQVQRYLGRISGPLLDRIDIQVEILPVPFKELSQAADGESSATIRERVVRARAMQSERFKDEPETYCNAQMTPRQLQKYCRMTPEAMARIEMAMQRYDMSARAFDRIRKVARTIADLEGSPEVTIDHAAEAITYRNLDRSTWGQTFNKKIFD